MYRMLKISLSLLALLTIPTSCFSFKEHYVQPEELGLPTAEEIYRFFPARVDDLITDFDLELNRELREEHNHPGIHYTDVNGKDINDQPFGNRKEILELAVGWWDIISYDGPENGGVLMFYGFSQGYGQKVKEWHGYEWEIYSQDENVMLYTVEGGEDKAARLAIVGDIIFICVISKHVTDVKKFDTHFFPKLDWEGLFQLTQEYGKRSEA